MRSGLGFLVPAGLAGLMACQPADNYGGAARDTQGAAVVTQAAGGLALRREPQVYLDSARHWLGSTDTSGLARMFGLAAPMLREHADMPTSAAKLQLRASADELDRLVERMRAGQLVTSGEYLPVLIRLNLSEAEHHRSQAAVAWVNHDTVTAGEDLLMAADHLDRAVRDARGAPEGLTATMIAEAQKLGAAMHRGEAFSAAEVDSKLIALNAAIQAERGPKVSKDAGP